MIKEFIIRNLKLLYSRKQCKYLASYGNNISIAPKIRLYNPKYISVGSGCYFGPGCRIEAWDHYNDTKYEPQILIGDNVKINSTCHIGAINKVEIGRDCLLGSHVMIIDHSHGKSELAEAAKHPSDRDLYSKGRIEIGEKCWIAENVVILPGVKIGEGCIIGANAVVTKSFPAFCVIAGNPAKIVKRLS